jgi:hypothetical protein
VFQNRRDQARLALSLERLLSRRSHFVDDGAEGEDVGPRVGVFALELLGRHVLEGAENGPLRRQVLPRDRGRQARQRARRRDARLGQAEIQKFRAGLREEDGARLEVPMHDAGAVSLGERIGRLDGVAKDLVKRQGASCGAVADLERERLRILQRFGPQAPYHVSPAVASRTKHSG